MLRYSAHFDVRTKNDVTWRHAVGFSQNFVRLFLFIISYFCPSLKWIWCSKQKLLAFVSMGGVLYRTFKPPVRAVFQLNIMIFFAQHSKKRQNCTLPKDFSKKHSKSAKIQFFQTLRYNTPPIDTQTIKEYFV